MLFGCSTVDDVQIELPLSKLNEFTVLSVEELDQFGWRPATEAELDYYFSRKILDNRKMPCVWSDGYGDQISCDGGECGVVETTGRDGQEYIGIMCYIDGAPSHSGSFRPKPMK